MPEVRKEVLGFRDAALSERHRLWGWDCPAMDMDFVMVEYDNGRATALVEYKHENARPQYPTHPSYRALVDMGDKAGIPVFAVRYAENFSWWLVMPLNAKAVEQIGGRRTMSEAEWVETLYRTRGREMPADVREAIENEVQW